MNIRCVKDGHTDEKFDGYCDRCGADLVLDDMLYPSVPSPTGLFDALAEFFEKIIAFFKSIFSF